MLQAIRDKTTGWIAYAIIFLISVPFALWGVNSYLGGGEAVSAATVNGEEIAARDFDQRYTNYRQRLARAFGGSIPASFGDGSLIKNQVLSGMIEELALRQYIDRQGYRIGDEALSKLIRTEQAFQKDGSFDSSTYQSQISSLGYSTLGFEQEYRRDQATAQLQAAISVTAYTLPERRKQFTNLTSQTRKIRIITRSPYTDSLSISEAEIDDYYVANASHYMSSEQVKVDYLELNLDAVKALVEVDDDLVLDRYEQAQESYTASEFRTASHILLTLDDAATDDESEQVRSRLQELRQEIIATGDFASIAREYSQDPGSAADGGNLGEIEPGVMVQPFEDALFQLQAGELSEPVKTAFGWHLIKLEQIRGGETRPLEQVRSEIEDEIKAEMAESQIFDILENLSNMAYEQPDSLLPAAEQMELTLQTSDWFDRNSGVGIGQQAQIRNAAFSDQVLRQGLNSEAIELGEDRVVFIRLNSHQPTAQLALDQVRERIVGELKREKTLTQNSALGKQALESLGSGVSFDQISIDWKVEVDDPGFVDRNNTEIDPDLLNRAFTMSKPTSGPVYEGHLGDNGSYALIELSGVISNDWEVDPEQIQSLTTTAATAEYQAIVKSLARSAEVVRTPLSELE
jgi:peptidyl-prolyl cis-trans isomerase D